MCKVALVLVGPLDKSAPSRLLGNPEIPELRNCTLRKRLSFYK